MVGWRDARRGSVALRAWFFPLVGMTNTEAEAECFEWFASRRAIVVSMTWSWGEIPAWVTKVRRMALG